MYRIWKYSSILVISQIIVAAIGLLVVKGRGLSGFLEDMDFVASATAIVSLIHFLYKSRETEAKEVGKFIFGIAMFSGFICNAISSIYGLMVGSKHASIFALILSTFFAFLVVWYIYSLCKRYQIEETKLAVLCAAPFGVGLVLGGIAGFLFKKF